MRKIKLLGKEYPYTASMGALIRYKEVSGKDVSEDTDADASSVILMMWCGVKAACSALDITFDMDLQQFTDALEPEEFIAFLKSNSEVKKKEDAGSPQ